MNSRPSLFPRVRLILLAGALSALTLTSGCIVAAVGVGAGGVAYVEGSVNTSFKAGVEATGRAANAALQSLDLAKVSETKTADSLGETIIARTGGDKRVELKLETAGEGITKVTVRVGAFGDEPFSRAILERIKANL